MSSFNKITPSTSTASSRSDDCAHMYSSATPTQPAICIPRVFPNITRRRILAIFNNLGLGDVCRIDMVHRVGQDGSEFYRVFVHLAWFGSETAVNTRRALAANEEVKIIYDEPWFWKLRASNSKGPHEKIRRPEPRIVMAEPSISAPAIAAEGEHVVVKKTATTVQASDQHYEGSGVV